VAADPKPADPKPADPQQNVGPKFKAIQSAAALLKQPLTHGDKSIGPIADLALDLETEHVALAIVDAKKIESKDATKESFVAVPTCTLNCGEGKTALHDWVTAAMLDKSRRLASKTPEITRHWAAEEYAAYEQDPYWVQFLSRRRQEDPEFAFDVETSKLALLSQLRGTPVTDQSGKKIGAIADFGIEPATSMIAYAAFAASSDDASKAGLRAIPLGAFEAVPGQKSWTIQLPAESITKFKPFEKDAWPTEIERGWTEYIAVRYGRGGLQSPESRQKAAGKP
jgi:sporulation protein YlmC with PRC-barrel domain